MTYRTHVRYQQFEAEIRDLVTRATPAARHLYSHRTIARLTAPGLLTELPEGELDAYAQRAFTRACDLARGHAVEHDTELTGAHPVDPVAGEATGREVLRLLDLVDAGVLTTGDMDPRLLGVLEALAYWARFLIDRDVEQVVRLALAAVTEIDYRVGVDLEDILSEPEMAAEFQRIRRELTDD